MTAPMATQMDSPDFMKLKSDLLNHPDGPLLFEDQSFLAKYSVLFNRTNPEFLSSDIIWRRPGQINKSPCLLKSFDTEVPTRFYQGKLTPFWFPILVAMLKEKDMLEKVIPNLSNQNSFNQDYSIITPVSTSYCGAFQFSFHRGMIEETVIIDDRLPTNISCHLLSAMTSDPDEYLPALLEKAYAKFLGGYYNLQNESLFTALMDFTGGLVESISKSVNEKISSTEIEEFFTKVTSITGESFVMCQINEYEDEELLDHQYQISLITGHTEIPSKPPDGLVDDLWSSLSDSRGDLVPAVRLYPLLDFQERNIIDRHILFKWQNCSFLVKMKYGLETNNSKEIWITTEDLLLLARRVIILHLFYRNPIVALAKNQPYWKFTFFESFWHKHDPKGSVETIGEDFLRNKQYLFVVDDDEGCSVKICLTNTQKYIDTGANLIELPSGIEIGIAIFQVEKNRLYRIHDLEHTCEQMYHVDYQMGRYLVISTYLDRGCYIVVPWISRGASTKYTMQVFASSMNSEIRGVDLDVPKRELCIPCQLRQTAIQSQNKLRSLYDRDSESNVDGMDRKSASFESEICQDCKSLYPKRATRISVIAAQNITLTSNFYMPNFYFRITCEKETYTSKLIQSTLSPRWNEHFLFYRMDIENSGASIELFCDNKLGLSSRIFEHSFTRFELMSDDTLFLSLDDAPEHQNETNSNKLMVEMKNYFISEFNLA